MTLWFVIPLVLSNVIVTTLSSNLTHEFARLDPWDRTIAVLIILAAVLSVWAPYFAGRLYFGWPV
jgi:hypothetical protein